MFRVFNKKIVNALLIFACVILVVLVYKKLNPLYSNIFPKCPFYYITGYKCPGCGSQRAIHELLNGNLKNAFSQNQLLVLSIPYIIFGFIVDKFNMKNKLLFIRKYLYGQYAIYIVIVILFLFTFVRNINII